MLEALREASFGLWCTSARVAFDHLHQPISNIRGRSEEAKENGPETAKKWRTRVSEGTTVDDMKLISAIHQYTSKFMPAKRPSIFLWRQILKRTLKTAAFCDKQHPSSPVQRDYWSDGATRSNT
jgi:hypothetical protein